MGVHQDSRLAGSIQPVGVNQRMALGGDALNILHADSAKLGGHEVSGAADVILVFA